MMRALLALARASDALNELTGQAVKWLVLAATLISAGNALLRYGFDLSSNAWLEAQWYLFALVVLLGAGYTLKHNGHVRVDVLYARCSPGWAGPRSSNPGASPRLRRMPAAWRAGRSSW